MDTHSWVTHLDTVTSEPHRENCNVFRLPHVTAALGKVPEKCPAMDFGPSTAENIWLHSVLGLHYPDACLGPGRATKTQLARKGAGVSAWRGSGGRGH